MSKHCELCQQTAPGTKEQTYDGFEVFICHNCKDTEAYLGQIEGMTKCVCKNWFDESALRSHLAEGPVCKATVTKIYRGNETKERSNHAI